jgi:probable rRNA maturation factor
MAVSFQNADIDFRLPGKTLLKNFIAASFTAETGKSLSAIYIFCSDKYLLKINQDFLMHDYYTDIITFPLSYSAKKVGAEIYISIDRITDNAAKLQVPFEQELERVIFHGILHLLGYKDTTSNEKEVMRAAEEKWLKAYDKFKQPPAG